MRNVDDFINQKKVWWRYLKGKLIKIYKNHIHLSCPWCTYMYLLHLAHLQKHTRASAKLQEMETNIMLFLFEKYSRTEKLAYPESSSLPKL